MVTNEKNIKQSEKPEIKTSRITSEQIEEIMADLGPYKKMTPHEAQELWSRLMPGESLSEEVIKMRDEGW